MSKTVAQFRAARAVELCLQGMTFDEIAVQLGYRDRSGPWRAAQRCLRRRQLAAADAYLATALIDLEMVEQRNWGRAMAGDLEASKVILRVIEDRLRLVELSTRQSTAKQSAVVTKPEPAAQSGTSPFGSMLV